MRSKLGALFMLAGVLCVAAAFLLLAANQRESQTAADTSNAALEQVVQTIASTSTTSGPSEGGTGASSATTASGLPAVSTVSSSSTADPLTPTALPDPYETEMTVVDIDGYGYIGYLSLPTLGLDLPVMADCDEYRLKLAPCRYFGSIKTNNLVIAAHNYTRHFGRLSRLGIGDEVLFTDMDGTTTCYQVAEIEILQPTAIESMTAGEYALTLFTCTYGGQSRITVRCDKV